MCGHGFRAMARTILDKELKFKPDYIAQQLNHVVKNPLGRAYNRTAHLKERHAMMQAWADYLDGLKLLSRRPETESTSPLVASLSFRGER